MSGADLQARLSAAEKTIRALSDRVEQQLAAGDSAFTTFAQNCELQRIVAGKTAELEREHAELARAHALLRTAHEELARAESELAQAQKLESVGRLASGIAHEINTPCQFVSDNVSFARESFTSLIPLVLGYRELIEEYEKRGGSPERIRALRSAEATADLEYVFEYLPQAFDGALEGLARITKLVRAMKDFAHPDQTTKTQSDLNRALASTLLVANGEYKLVAQVETAYGDLPLVVCNVSEVNQVFLNLIVNAAHAIADRIGTTGERGHIRVETAREGAVVRISISDDGAGIPPHVAARIFEPFFTTKGVGRGTGQGLAIAHAVVVTRHGGQLTFETEPGRGTTFHVRLPIEG